MLKSWSAGLAAAVLLTSWVGGGDARAELTQETQDQINELCAQPGFSTEQLTGILQGLTPNEIGVSVRELIQFVPDSRRRSAAKEFVGAAIGMAEANPAMDVLAVAEELGAGVINGVNGIESLTGFALEDELASVASACAESAVANARVENRVAVARKFAAGTIQSAEDEDQILSITGGMTYGAVSTVDEVQREDVAYGITEGALESVRQGDNVNADAVASGVRQGTTAFDAPLGMSVRDRVNQLAEDRGEGDIVEEDQPPEEDVGPEGPTDEEPVDEDRYETEYVELEDEEEEAPPVDMPTYLPVEVDPTAPIEIPVIVPSANAP